MIKKLQRRFILIVIGSMTAVFGLLVGAMNIANYRSLVEQSVAMLEFLAENGGRFPGDERLEKLERRDFSPETPFTTRYYTVKISAAGEAIAVDTDKIAAIDSETAERETMQYYNAGITEGFHGSYRFAAFSQGNETLYIFLDCQRELDFFETFLLVSISISILVLALVSLLVILFSGRAIQPLAESYEKQKRFITDAGHEIKTPLSIIDAGAEVLEMEYGKNEWTETIQSQVRRLTSLTEKLVLLSRMEEENSSASLMNFSLSDAIIDMAAPFRAMAEAKGKHFTYDVQENVLYYGDESGIRQMISLLLDNAMKYSNDGGDISLSLRTSGRTKEIMVKNTVDEITVGKQDVLFERFYRPDTSRNSRTGGFGLGLSVVKAIVQSHHGKISAESSDGKSITFTILL